MYSQDDIIHIAFVAFIDISAMLLNVLFVFVIRKRVVNVDGFIIFVHIGPCTHFHQHLCHFFLAAHNVLCAHSVYLLIISFACRLWMLNADALVHLSVITRRIWLAVIVVTLISALNMVILFLALTDSAPGKFNLQTISVLNVTGGQTRNLLPRSAVLIVISTISVGFGTIFMTQRRLYAGLSKLSSAKRYSHQQIYRSLTAQTLLPLAHNVAGSLWLLDAIGLVRSSLLQRSVYTLTSVFALISPLINMYFIAPYRIYIRSCFSSTVLATKVAQPTDSKI